MATDIYTSAKPCKHCGSEFRYALGRNCVMCARKRRHPRKKPDAEQPIPESLLSIWMRRAWNDNNERGLV